MQITITQAEISQAVKGFIASQGISLANKSVEVKFTATRGNDGIIATIDVENVEAPAPLPQALVTAPVAAAPTRVSRAAVTQSETTAASKSVKEITDAAINAVLPEDEVKGDSTPVEAAPAEAEEVKPAVKAASLFA